MTGMRVTWRHPAMLAALFLLIGWWPFSLHPPNRASWLSGRNGLAFRSPGIAYDDVPVLPSGPSPGVAVAPGLTLELQLVPAARPSSGVSHILTFDDDGMPAALVLGQWRSELLLRVPAPATPRGFRETGARLLEPRQPRVVIVSGDASGTTFYADGRFVERMPNFRLPVDALRGRLLLGSGATGRGSWTGLLLGVAVFARTIDAGEAAEHSASWLNGDVSALSRDPAVIALYAFDEGAGLVARDASPRRHHLRVPERFVVLRKTFLEFPGIALPIGLSMFGDVVINLAGFVPLGLLAFLSAQRARLTRRAPLVVAVLAGGLLSLTIEVGQAWLPARNSTTADLVLNITGTVIGAGLARWLWRVGIERRPE